MSWCANEKICKRKKSKSRFDNSCALTEICKFYNEQKSTAELKREIERLIAEIKWSQKLWEGAINKHEAKK